MLEAAINWYRAKKIASARPSLRYQRRRWSVGRRAAELTEQFVSGPYRFVEIEGWRGTLSSINLPITSRSF